jgi:hypothetical protein
MHVYVCVCVYVTMIVLMTHYCRFFIMLIWFFVCWVCLVEFKTGIWRVGLLLLIAIIEYHRVVYFSLFVGNTVL